MVSLTRLNIFIMETLNDYDYFLPPELIATTANTRESSRLLRLAKTDQKATHDVFSNIDAYLKAGDVLVVNNTKVMKARFYARKKSGGRVEILLVRPLVNGHWAALMNGRGPFPCGTKLHVEASEHSIEVVQKMAEEPGLYELHSAIDLGRHSEQYGFMPIPRYFGRESSAEDEHRYQTIFSRPHAWGAVAAPTAGLHFTDDLVRKLKHKGVVIVEITLHVGPGTFLPIRVTNIAEHRMHSEWFSLSEEAAVALNHAKASGHRVIAVGTTALRVLEQSMLWAEEQNRRQFFPCSGTTALFIRPGFQFKAADGLITNFHVPRSTLLVLVSAVIGRSRALACYEDAVKLKYRFFSYGDACFFDMVNN